MIIMNILTLSSKVPRPIPEAAPDPASPMKCPEPILLANRDAPTYQEGKMVFLFLSW